MSECSSSLHHVRVKSIITGQVLGNGALVKRYNVSLVPCSLCFSTAVQDLPTETKVESERSQSKSGSSVKLSHSGKHFQPRIVTFEISTYVLMWTPIFSLNPQTLMHESRSLKPQTPKPEVRSLKPQILMPKVRSLKPHTLKLKVRSLKPQTLKQSS